MTYEHPVVERYLAHFDTSIRELEFPDRQEVVEEIRNHIAEARAAGKPLDAVVEALGPADALARAYAIELLLNAPRGGRFDTVGRFLKVAGIVAAAGLATLVVAGTLGAIGVTLVASGILIAAIGVMEAAGVHLPGVQTAGLAPFWIIAIGLVMLPVGALALVGFRLYIRALVRTLKRVLPRRDPA